MQIIVDTREQAPLLFRLDEVLTSVVTDTLHYGDYAAKVRDGNGREVICPIRFERKSLGDLYGSLTSGYARFRREIERAKGDGAGIILIIEGTLTDVITGFPFSDQEPRSLIRRIFSIWMHHDVFPVFSASRQEMATYIKCFFEAFEKNLRRSGREDATDAKDGGQKALVA